MPQAAKIFSLPLNILPSYFLFGLLLPPDPPLLLLLFALPVSVLLCQGVAALLLRARLPSLLLPLIILNFLLPDLTLPPSPDHRQDGNSTQDSVISTILISTVTATSHLYTLPPSILPSLTILAAICLFSPLLALSAILGAAAASITCLVCFQQTLLPAASVAGPTLQRYANNNRMRAADR